ncbi:MAG: lysoplasmalogenase [Planctomycetes bacterium]|nr:lysoplasmalogenase [Planctomycetota bacterium]
MTLLHALGPLLAVPCLAALLVSVYREQAGRRRVIKPLCSLTFVLAALLATPPGREHLWAYLGLGLSFVGDILLLGEDRRALGGGLAAFLLAHACYLAWVLPGVHWGELPLWTLLLALPLLAAGGWILRAAWPRLGALAAPAVLYFCALSFLTWAALATWLGQAPGDPAAALRGLGLGLFFASDIAVARHRLVVPGFVNKAWGLPTYYLSQHFLALSLASTL